MIDDDCYPIGPKPRRVEPRPLCFVVPAASVSPHLPSFFGMSPRREAVMRDVPVRVSWVRLGPGYQCWVPHHERGADGRAVGSFPSLKGGRFT
jgi:hypothetical protein